MSGGGLNDAMVRGKLVPMGTGTRIAWGRGLLVLASALFAGTGCGTTPGQSGSHGVQRPSYNTGTGFFIGKDNKLYDANGHLFHVEGVNRVHYDDNAGPAIAASGANTERWVLYWKNGTTAAQFVQQITTEDHDNGIVAIPGVWTTAAAYGGVKVTCNSDPAALTHAVDEWVAQAKTWKKIERWSMIDIANEWGPSTSTVWRDSYETAISRMRTAGYTGTLLVDAGGCGEDAKDIIDYGQAVLDSDPQKNVLFDIHVYYNVQAGQAQGFLGALHATGLPILVGEFGPGRDIGPAPTNLTPGELITAAESDGMGWLAWAWDDNDLAGAKSDDKWFAMIYGNSDPFSKANLTTYGKDVVLDPGYGIQATAVPATVFP